MISSVAVLVLGLLADLNHCFWEETTKRGVMRWGSLDCLGSELSALPIQMQIFTDNPGGKLGME